MWAAAKIVSHLLSIGGMCNRNSPFLCNLKSCYSSSSPGKVSFSLRELDNNGKLTVILFSVLSTDNSQTIENGSHLRRFLFMSIHFCYTCALCTKIKMVFCFLSAKLRRFLSKWAVYLYTFRLAANHFITFSITSLSFCGLSLCGILFTFLNFIVVSTVIFPDVSISFPETDA